MTMAIEDVPIYMASNGMEEFVRVRHLRSVITEESFITADAFALRVNMKMGMENVLVLAAHLVSAQVRQESRSFVYKQ